MPPPPPDSTSKNLTRKPNPQENPTHGRTTSP